MINCNYLTPPWNAPPTVHAAMTLRCGGVSKAPFASLNPALHVADNSSDVLRNRALLKELLQLPSEPVWLNQTHSNRVVCADQPPTEAADASFTEHSGVVCAVLTADCLPVVFCSRDGKKIAAAHAGWRGLQAGILSNTVTALQTTDLSVWLAPAIGASCFEVGTEVRELFCDKNGYSAQAFVSKTNGKWLADIYQLARLELAQLGVTQVVGGEFCTVSDPQRFYSYRRDGQTGRMATLIWKD